MNDLIKKAALLSLVAATMLTAVACKSESKTEAPPAPAPAPAPATVPVASPTPSESKNSVVAIKPGTPGGIIVETRTITANVTAVDAANRSVTLAASDGSKAAVKCGPEVRNFEQIKVGDQLKLTVTEELAVAMVPEGTTPVGGEAAVVALAPKGDKPAAVMAGTVQVVATVTAIDVPNRKATLTFADGSKKTVAVRPDIDLSQRKVGEKVLIRLTEKVAISVDKP